MTARQITSPLSRIWQGFARARQNWVARRELSQLDDRMLKDLGLSRAQAAFEIEQHSIWFGGPHHGS